MAKNNLTYNEQLQLQIRKATKQKNFLAVLYYSERLGTTSACASWETFKGSAAGQEWIKKHQAEADKMAAEHKARFAYLY